MPTRIPDGGLRPLLYGPRQGAKRPAPSAQPGGAWIRLRDPCAEAPSRPAATAPLQPDPGRHGPRRRPSTRRAPTAQRLLGQPSCCQGGVLLSRGAGPRRWPLLPAASSDPAAPPAARAAAAVPLAEENRLICADEVKHRREHAHPAAPSRSCPSSSRTKFSARVCDSALHEELSSMGSTLTSAGS